MGRSTFLRLASTAAADWPSLSDSDCLVSAGEAPSASFLKKDASDMDGGALGVRGAGELVSSFTALVCGRGVVRLFPVRKQSAKETVPDFERMALARLSCFSSRDKHI